MLLKPYAEYYAEYEAKVAELTLLYPLGKPIVGEASQKTFIALFGAILRLRNILTAFDDFAGSEILTDREFQDYQSIYLDLYAEFRRVAAVERESINDDVIFEIELIKQIEVNVDYIFTLVQKHLDGHGSGQDREIRAAISRAIDSNPTLRNKKDLIEQFVDSLTVDADVDESWRAYVAAARSKELDQIIADENLVPDATRTFLDNAFRDGAIPSTGTAVTKMLPPVSRFYSGNAHALKKQVVLDRLAGFFERFFGLA